MLTRNKEKKEDDKQTFWDFLGKAKEETSKWPQSLRDNAQYLFEEKTLNFSELGSKLSK